ncbi:hypothetical protein GCM10008018_28610 [Paenibacillus marchantiophytorum]|uniref:Uncharacterized protein n=2 Tax=Paenibacillus marchantiophytorum TaxID=1619310 RepID=A0ABQ1EPS3_9BACL|nr:hypothetical protein GCM10008018_28610 [Paenibacillus marchantiophytorum]
MSVERAILILAWVICMTLMPILVPKNRIRQAVLLFLSTQLITWVLSVMFVEWGFYENPIREFPAASGSNFTNNYLLFPFISTMFSLYYPNSKSSVLKWLFQARFVIAIGTYCALISKYSNLLEYRHFNVYFHMLVIWAVLNITRKYEGWFFSKEGSSGKVDNPV